MVRVAAVQFAVGSIVAHNLESTLSMLDLAAAAGAEVVVTPEFCNHASWYRDRAHAYDEACELDGPFLAAVAERAKRHSMFVQCNVVVRRDSGRLTGTNVLFNTDGAIVATSDKTVLMGGERLYLDPGNEPNPVVDLPFAVTGSYACMEGVMFEPPRSLAVRGATLLLNSLNSFALDEAALHIPVRAAENHVHVVAANKVGPLVPEEFIDHVAASLKIPASALHGAGESQIVAPDGTVIAMGSRTESAVVVADIEPAQGSRARLSDGTNVLLARRPELYGALAKPSQPPEPESSVKPLSPVVVAASSGPFSALEQHVHAAAAAKALLLVLPEKSLGALTFAEVVECLTVLSKNANGMLIATSAARGDAHVGVAVGPEGVVLEQQQLHRTNRLDWVRELGSSVSVLELDWCTLALVVGDDLMFPETVRLAALKGADLVACTGSASEDWELRLGAPERSAENRVCLAVATDDITGAGALLTSFPAAYTLWAERSEPFDGRINTPIITRSVEGLAIATLHPAHAANKFVSNNTSVLHGRPWEVLAPLTRS